jgi:hypothetical protein
VLLAGGTLMLVFRRHVFAISAEIFGRGRLAKFYDLDTQRGRQTLLFNFTVFPALFVIAGAFGLVSALLS